MRLHTSCLGWMLVATSCSGADQASDGDRGSADSGVIEVESESEAETEAEAESEVESESETESESESESESETESESEIGETPNTCTRACDGRICGFDGGGGVCGDCAVDQYCTPAGTCSATFVTGLGIDDRDAVYSVPALARPAAGAGVVDPNFGTTIRRVSARSEAGPTAFEVQIYSQLQAVSADGQYLLTSRDDTGYVVRCIGDLGLLTLPTLANINVPRWLPDTAHTLVHFDTNADDVLLLQETEVVTGVTTTVATLAGYTRIFGNQSFDEVSRDGVWLAGMAARADGAEVLFAYDRVAMASGAVLAIPDLYAGPCQPDPTYGNVPPDWVAPSPLGAYLVVQWKSDGTSRCHGLETFDIRTGAFVGRVHDAHQHGDLGVVPNWQSAPAGAREFFMTFETYQNGHDLSVGYRFLPGTVTVATSHLVVPLDWGVAAHISCQGPPGVCLLTGGGGLGATARLPFQDELVLMYLDGRVRRVAHHRSSQCGYWAQPRATMAADGSFAVFSSDWGDATCGPGNETGHADPYLVGLVGACAPRCTDKACGDNGCGGSCGTCAADETCTGGGQCRVPGPATNMSFFVTSIGNGPRGGDFGGLAGADDRCEMLAEAAGITGRSWVAYLSTTAVNARDRIGPGPWYNANGELVASDADALHTSGLAVARVRDENGDVIDYVNAHDIMTGASQAGGLDPLGANCADYTSSSPEVYGAVGHANGSGVGQARNGGQVAQSWNAAHIAPCDQVGMQAQAGRGHLYCFAP